MTKHTRQGKTFFVNSADWHYQFAYHRSPSGHFSYIAYCDGVQEGKAQRCTQAQAATMMGLSVPELLEKFKLD